MNVLIPPARRILLTWTVIVGVAVTQGFGQSSAATSEFCVQWVTYKDPNTGACVPCSQCPEGYIAAVLCEFDRDTLCRPATDLGRHIESVVHHRVSNGVEASVDPGLVHSTTIQKKLNNPQEEVSSIPQKENTSPLIILVICLSSAFIISVVFAIMCIIKNCQRKEVEPNPLDPLKRGLLLDQDDHGDNEAEKSPMDLDELLAVRYGRSLVKNNYIL